jgi:RNA polymerase sigma-70 factor, ECF subfamily
VRTFVVISTTYLVNGGGDDGFLKKRVSVGDVESQRRMWLASMAMGDQEAFSALYREFSPRLYGYLRLRINNEGDIQDLMQDILMTVWRSSGRFAGTASVSTWIFGIARNKMLDLLRVRYKTTQLEVPWPEDTGETQALAEQDFADLKVTELAIATAFDTLPPHYAEVIYLVFVESMSYKEISTLLDIQEGTVKSRMHQAKARLRKQLQEGGSHDG